jgi:hypothetical protein
LLLVLLLLLLFVVVVVVVVISTVCVCAILWSTRVKLWCAGVHRALKVFAALCWLLCMYTIVLRCVAHGKE